LASLTTRTLARSWVALTGLLLLLEVIFLSFAGLLYSMKVVFYD
jgi:hypothetical protein